MKKLNVLSLFDGMSCGRIALDRAGFEVGTYYASEVDKFAIKEVEANWPETVQLGDVTAWRNWSIDWSSIDLVTGGFPCQSWSMAGKQLGDKDERGMLLWTMLDIIKNVLTHNPGANFIMENVKMKKEFEEYITRHTEQALGKVNKTLINSSKLSAQNRSRNYWTNFPVTQPDDKGLSLADVIEEGVVDRDKAHCIDANYFKGGNLKSYFEKHRRQLVFCSAGRDEKGDRRLRAKSDKCPTITARYYKGVKSDGAPFIYSGDKDKGELFDYNADLNYRKLTVVECCRLQTVPDDYFKVSSNTQAYKMLGNGWTVDVIAWILSSIK